jgi:hypothetical protein
MLRDVIDGKADLVDLVGIEPTTSSMPCCGFRRKLLTVKHLLVGKTGKTGLIGDICYQNATKINLGRSGCDVGGQLEDVHFLPNSSAVEVCHLAFMCVQDAQ